MNLNDPRIEAYLNQEMSEVDAQKFEREAQANPEVWDHIQFQQFMIQGIREEGAAELKDFIANRMTEEVEDDFTSRNIWWSVAATLIILAVGLGVTYKFQWLDSEKNIVAKNDLHQEEKNSILEKSEPPLNESDESKSQSAADTFLMPEIFADNEDANITTADAPIDDAFSSSTLKDEKRSDPLGDMGKMNVAPFVVSTIELNTVSRSKVLASANNLGKNKRKNEPSIKGDTVTDYLNKGRIAQSTDGDGIESNSNSASTFKKIKSEATKQFLITLSEQSGITKPQVVMGGWAEGKINLTIWNAGSVDILIFHLEEEYYIQLGNNFYYLPLIPVSMADLKPVSDRAILEKLKQ